MKIPELVVNGKRLWDTWSIRAFIILSLSLQTFLILVAPLRKRTSNMVIAFLIWSAYLLADWVAIFVVGHTATSEIDSQLLGFWAPFLLLHLGGPDTITALNLEDNSLWVRHLLSLLLQVITTGYILFQAFPPGSKLLVPAILIFMAGILKYFERTRALYHASIGQYRNSIFKNSSKSTSDPQCTYFREGVDLGDCTVAVKHAYTLYNESRGVIVDLVLWLDKHGKIRRFFQNIVEPEDALKLLSIELNFFYDALYTKAVVVRKGLGFVFRCLVYVNVTVALVLFVTSSKDTYRNFDVKLTYALLFGAIALEGIALLMIWFSDWPSDWSSDWSVPSTIITKFKNACFLTRILNYFKRKRSTSLVLRRWSESISRFSLFFPSAPPREGLLYFSPDAGKWLLEPPETSDKPSFCGCLHRFIACLLVCLHNISSFIISICFTVTGVKFLFNYVVNKSGAREEIDAFKHVSSDSISKELWDFIFKELREKSSKASQDPAAAQKILRAKGDWVLQTDEFREDCQEILCYVKKSEYDEVLLTWNIATELCFYAGIFVDQGAIQMSPDANKQRSFSIILSSYMLYLLVRQPQMMPTSAGEVPLRYRDILRDIREYTDDKIGTACKDKSEDMKGAFGSERFDHPVIQCMEGKHARLVEIIKREEVCAGILESSGSNVEAGSKSKLDLNPLFSNACELAKTLSSYDVEKRWRIMSKVWVEILSYAASHGKGEAHAKALSGGGELITFVWLLMIHLGISQSGNIEVLVTA